MSRAGYWRFPLGNCWLQVVGFRDRPKAGAITLCSLGLWNHELCSHAGQLRQELVLASDGRLDAVDGRLASVFPSVLETVLADRVALTWGQLFGPMGPVISEVSPLEWLLCLPPRPFPQSFAICSRTEPLTQFVWLVPISAGEAGEVQSGNLADLERRWQEQGVDLLDWHRKA